MTPTFAVDTKGEGLALAEALHRKTGLLWGVIGLKVVRAGTKKPTMRLGSFVEGFLLGWRARGGY